MVKQTKTYITLLRGINVGGKNIIKMVDLKACFETMGFSNVLTYIQSGNVLFNAQEQDLDQLTDTVEKALMTKFNIKLRVVIVSSEQLKGIIQYAPKGFGSKPDIYRYDVIFLKHPLTATEAIKEIKVKEGVDEACVGENVLYFSSLTVKAAQSHLTRVITLPIYQRMTIRNWNTTTKLLTLTKI